MFDAVKLPLAALGGALAAAAIVGSVAYFSGKSAGKREAAVAALETSVKVLRDRGETDAAISTATAGELCAHYELSVEDVGECVRRLAEASAEAGNRDPDHH